MMAFVDVQQKASFNSLIDSCLFFDDLPARDRHLISSGWKVDEFRAVAQAKLEAFITDPIAISGLSFAAWLKLREAQ